MSPYPPIDVLIPHQPPMRLIDKIASEIDEGLVLVSTPDATAWYADKDGAMPAWMGIELMAQSISAWAGLQAWRVGLPLKKGFLIGTREYKSARPSFAAGEELFIEVHKIFYESQGLAAFNCSIRAGSIMLAEAIIKVINIDNYETALDPSGKNT